jgi:uncharacterized membrane protein (DUF485 family)
MAAPNKDLRERAAGEGFDVMELPVEALPRAPLPSPAVAVLPLVLVIALNLLFTFVIIPAMDTGFLALPQYGETSIDQVRGIWAVIAALVLSILVVIALNWRRLSNLKASVDSGANASQTSKYKKMSVTDPDATMATTARNRRVKPVYRQACRGRRPARSMNGVVGFPAADRR